jgi:hypothetical protein
MKLWSRGLGKQELKMNFMDYDVRREGQEVVISGRITDPVNWDFWIRFDEDDVPGLVRVAKNPSVIAMVGRHWFKKIFLFWRRPAVPEAPEEPAEKVEVEAAQTSKPEPGADTPEDK